MKQSIITITLFQFLLILSTCCSAQIQKSRIELGKKLFQQSCQNCHGARRDIIAPSFRNIRQTRGLDWVYKFVQNPAAFASVNPDAKKSLQKWKMTMQAFPSLSKHDISAICDYVDSMPDNFKPKQF